jgi:hypothetical protein
MSKQNNSIINSIINKPSWKTKILDNTIRTKWIREFCEQGADHNIVSNIINILKNHVNVISSDQSYQKQNLEYYDWFVDITYIVKEIIPFCYDKCRCNCIICSGDEYLLNMDESEYTQGDHELINDPNITHYLNCECYKKINDAKKQFLNNNVFQIQNLISGKEKANFKSAIEFLDKSDTHPNTNGIVTNITHPSLYPYVKGMSRFINSNVEEHIDPNMIFQWLPANVSVSHIRGNKDNKQHIITTKFKSPINGIPLNESQESKQIYESIESIFSQLVPYFEQTLDKLKQTGRAVNNFPNDHILTDCQVIVKIQEINLDSERGTTSFDEGLWHLEGTYYEKIIATGIYYYETNNISDTYLNFRVGLSPNSENDLNYQQYSFEHVKHHYGIDVEVGYNMEIGSIQTKEDLCLVWPNTLQHKVSNVQLRQNTDQSMDQILNPLRGTRKILVFFLIDPSQTILSTADIEPQEEYINLETAHVNRMLLMFDRKYETQKQDEVYEREWSLCEH